MSNSSIGIGDDVTISAKVIDVRDDKVTGQHLYRIKLPSSKIIYVADSDIKSYHPYKPIPENDERKGN